MGWMRGIGPTKLLFTPARNQEAFVLSKSDERVGVQHIENIAQRWPLQATEVSDKDLPFISAAEVQAKQRPGVLSGNGVSEAGLDWWIVVDDIVYDCTSFVSEHPGGKQVILSFVGDNCSCMRSCYHFSHRLVI